MEKPRTRGNRKWEETGRGVIENGKKPEEGEWKMKNGRGVMENGKWKI
jgi:hypothetical protein